MHRTHAAVLAAALVAAVSSCRETTGPEARTPAVIEVVSGDGQAAITGAALDSPLVVRVEDAAGRPVAGTRVLFSVQSGGGALGRGEATTGSDGLALASWTLGALVETEQRVVALVSRANGEPLRATFTAMALPTGPVAVITDIAPALLTPGSLLTMTGANLDHVVRVTVAGVTVQILDRTASTLTARLPESGFACAPTQDANVLVATAGGEVLRRRPLRIAAIRSLQAGDVLLGTIEDSLACIELPADGSRYMIAVANVAADIASAPGLRVRGVSTQSAPPLAAAPAASMAAHTGTDDAFARRHTAALRHDAMLRANSLTGRILGGSIRARATGGLSRLLEDAAVGDTVSMRIPRLSAGSASELCTTYDNVVTRVIHAGTRSLVLEDIVNPMAGTLDSLYRAVGTEFDTRQYDVVSQNFADPLRLGTRVHMVFSRRINDFGVSGFVWAGDLAPREVCEQSNEAEVFYGYVPVSAGTQYAPGTRAEWFWTIRPTVVHEVKHIAAMAERLAGGMQPEEPWLEEATAMVAEELWARHVFGYEQHDNTRFQQSVGCEIEGAFGLPPCAGMPSAMFAHYLLLSAWMQEPGNRSLLGPTTAQDVSYYGTGWLFLRWLLDHASRTEAVLLSELVTADAIGVANIEARFETSFETALPRWAAAVALDDRAGTLSPAPLRIPSWHLRDVFSGLNREQPSLFPTTFPLRVRTFGFGNVLTDVSMVRGGGAAFFELAGTHAAPQVLAFQGLGGGPLPGPLRVIVIRLE